MECFQASKIVMTGSLVWSRVQDITDSYKSTVSSCSYRVTPSQIRCPARKHLVSQYPGAVREKAVPKPTGQILSIIHVGF